MTKERGKKQAREEADSRAQIVVAWDPRVISDEEYAELICALGDLVRAEGALGIERVRSRGHEVCVKDGVPT